MYKRNSLLRLLVAVASAAAMAACADERFHGPSLSNAEITINATINDKWQQVDDGARSAGSEPEALKITQGRRAESETCASPLYIFETVSESFDADKREHAASGKPGSRGTVVKNDNMGSHPIGVYAFFDRRADHPFYMWNEPYKCTDAPNAHNIWRASNGYLWPVYEKDGMNHLAFFAYSPYRKDGSDQHVAITKAEENGECTLRLHYVVADAVEDQHDLLVTPFSGIASADEMSAGMPLEFDHALSSVRVRYSSGSMYPGKVTNVTFKNVIGEGIYDADTRTWDISGSALRDYSFDLDVENGEVIGNYKDGFTTHTGDILGSELVTLMMMPQNSADREGPDPEISITFVDDASGTTHIFASKLNIDWEKGHAYTYNIKSTNMHTEYYFNVEVDGGDLMNTADCSVLESHPNEARRMYACGNNTDVAVENQPSVKVESWYEVVHLAEDGTTVLSKGKCPAHWDARVCTKGENGFVDKTPKPGDSDTDTLKWFHNLYQMRGGSDRHVDKMVTVVPITVDPIEDYKTVSAERDKILNNRSAKYDDYDLSTEGGTKPRSTANCYIISSPGTYRIPLVYGNAIKNGEANPQAYTHAPGSNILAQFLRHDDRAITDPWISKNTRADGTAFRPDKARLERFQSIAGHYKDAVKSGEDRIQDFKVDGDYFTFKVVSTDAEPLYPCNAVISVLEGETVLWSWHIWITGLFIGDEEKYYDEGGHKIMKHALGKTDFCHTVYEERDLLLHFVQKTENDTERRGHDFVARFVQEGWDAHEVPQTLSYQYGRMTPLYAHLYRRYVDKSGNPELKSLHRYFLLHKDNDDLENHKETSNTIGYVLQHPKSLFWGGASNHPQVYNYSSPYVNLWNNGTDEAPIKTVYDPSPAGFMVPPTAAVWDAIGDISFGLDYENDPGEYYIFKAGQSTFVRGAVVNQLENGKPKHNFRYTPYWTAKYVPSTGVNGFGFQFDNPGDPVDARNTWLLLNEPRNPHKWTPSSCKPAWLAAVRPIVEP